MFFFAFLTVVQGVYFPIDGKGVSRCFSLQVGPEVDLFMAYVVSGEKDQNVQVIMKDHLGFIVYSSAPRTREGKFEMKSDKLNVFSLCFESKDRTSKTISFDFYLQDGLAEEKIATQDEITPLRTLFRKVSRSLDTVYRNIQFYERRERTHRDLAEVTCDRVVFSGVIKMLVLALISISQIYMLRSFFNNKRGIQV